MSKDRQLINAIKNENVPAIKDQNDNILFGRDYDKGRIILDFPAYEVLISNGQLPECVNYFKRNKLIDYITLFKLKNNGIDAVNLYIDVPKTYFVPMLYKGEESISELNDDIVHYTDSAIRIEKNEEFNSDEIKKGKTMVFCTIMNQSTMQKYIPLFKSIDELRKIFPRENYRIAKISYEEAIEFAKEVSGVVFRPTKESFIILNNITSLFSGVDEFINHSIN